MRELDKEMRVYDKPMRELEKKMDVASEQAQRDTEALFGRVIASGIARPLKP